jgi:hypothetical protein
MADCFAVALTSTVWATLEGVFVTIQSATLFYNGTVADFDRTFAKFLTIPDATMILGPLSYNDITHILPAGNDRIYSVSHFVS